MTNPNYQTAKDFLAILFTTYFQHHDGYVEIRCIPPKGSAQPTISKWLRRGELSEQDWLEIARLNETHHIYFGVNPRPLSKDKKQDDIKDIVCLWVDVDGKEFDGLKAEALDQVKAFPVPPSLTVDSGHGYHLYWILKEPIINLTGEARTGLKQLLSGMIKRLGGDKARINLDSCLRLPGTLNIKDSPPLECTIIDGTDAISNLLPLEPLRDTTYEEPEAVEEGELPEFGKRSLVVSVKDEKAAHEDVEKLEVTDKTKKLILTGAMLRAKDADTSRSGRDFSIICSLIYWGYKYATIRSVFLNPFLKCGNRIREEGEGELLKDVRRALQFVTVHRAEGTAQSRDIASIRADKTMSADEKRQAINDYIADDLLTGPKAIGVGFRKAGADTCYVFDTNEKALMDLDSVDFYCFMRERFGISDAEFRERQGHIRSIINRQRAEVTPRRWAWWDDERKVLYVSNGANGFYRLDGAEITLHDNGEDRVFFEQDPAIAPWTFTAEGAVNYFATYVPEIRVSGITMPAGWRLGLDWERFNQPDVLLKKHLTDWASFEKTDEYPLDPEEQRLLLLVYFYSLFFESIQRDKPIATFVGTMESGKSTVAKLMGKILFGEGFDCSGKPKSADDLAVTLGGSYYVVIDNLDSRLDGDILDAMCSAATGVITAKRRLYKDDEIARIPVHAFLAITSREPRFKEGREDLVARLLLFNTKRVANVVGPTALFTPVLRARSRILSEVAVNLNSIVAQLRWMDDPTCWIEVPAVMRHATDWDTLGHKMMGGLGPWWRTVMLKLSSRKGKFAIEDSDQFQVLQSLCYGKGWAMDRFTSGELYEAMADEAMEMKIRDFSRHCPNPKRLAGWIKANQEALEQEFEIVIDKNAARGRQHSYSIKARQLAIAPAVKTADMLASEREQRRRAR